jgi:hypothetical protein
MNKVFLIGLFAAILIALLSGCASTSRSQNSNLSDGQAVTACPQCKSVLIQPTESLYMQWDEEGFREPAYFQHECPECRGAISTLIQDGEFRHKCSVCEEGPYSCDLFVTKERTVSEQ